MPAARQVAGEALVSQNINSQRVAELLAGSPGSPVLDVCAAPGGKSPQLAESAAVVAAVAAGGGFHVRVGLTATASGPPGVDTHARD